VTELKQIFIEKKWTLSFAESCTGGLVSARITSEPGVSRFFIGSIVCYSNSVKNEILNVPLDVLKNAGAVSRDVALLMAKGVKKNLRTDWAAAVTGIAGPSGGTKDKPVGTVWFALCGPNIEWSEKQVFQGDRQQIQEGAVRYILESLNNRVRQSVNS
jgi:nicotinamide-nucleotide amidase